MTSKLVWLIPIVFLVTLIFDSNSEDIKTKSGLTKLYNRKVVKVELVQRPISSNWIKKFIPHRGVRITTASGKKYLVHKGPDYGKCSKTVVTHACHMSNKWKCIGKGCRVVNNHTVGDFVKAGGEKYNWFFCNCLCAAKKMFDLGDKKSSCKCK